jgi:CheY-like chemotaxis protein
MAMKVLIVDDNQAMRRLIRSILGGSVEVFECRDGALALASYGALRPDWVLMDIRMPQINGIEATRRILSDYPEAQVIIVTDYDDERLRNSAEAAGACGYLLKEDLLVLQQMLAPKPDTSLTK